MAFLGSALVENGLISEAQLDKALHLQQQTNPLLGELAIEQGWLDAQQVEDINVVQRIVNQRFGDIAQEEMLLTANQVQQLLDIQQQRRQRLGDILIREGFIGRDVLAQTLRKLKRETDRSDFWDKLTPIQAVALRSMESLFNRVFKSQCQHTRLVNAARITEHYQHIITLTICEDSKTAKPFMQLSVACNFQSLQEMTASFTGLAIEDCDEALARDTLGELLNMTAGYIISDPKIQAQTQAQNLKPTPAVLAHSLEEICLNNPESLTAVSCNTQWGTSATLIGLSG
jgi:hypothetical protein